MSEGLDQSLEKCALGGCGPLRGHAALSRSQDHLHKIRAVICTLEQTGGLADSGCPQPRLWTLNASGTRLTRCTLLLYLFDSKTFLSPQTKPPVMVDFKVNWDSWTAVETLFLGVFEDASGID